MIYWLTLAVALALTLALTPLVGVLGRRLGLVDRPGGRRQHTGVIPRTGGLALFGGFFLTVLLTLILPEVLPGAWSAWFPPRNDPNEDRRLLALLNERGEVIGVNAQIRSEVRANSGIGFAIPISVVERVVPALIEQGEYQHSYLGVGGDTFSPICAESLNLPPELRGAIVTTVFTNTPAARAGLRSGTEPSNTRYPGICPQVQGGDVITAIEGQPVTTFEDVLSFLTRHTSPDDTVTLDIYRDGRSITVDVTLAARPRN